MSLKKTAILLLTFLTATSCIAQRKKDNQNTSKYSENLAKVRPSYQYNLDSILVKDSSINKNETFITLFTINNEVTPLLDSIAQINKSIKYIRGYRVLVYSGNAQEEALEVRKAILEIFEEYDDLKNIPVDFMYHQPMFRVKVGKYDKRLDAVRMVEYLKQQKFDFGEDSEIRINPLVVPDNIEIRK